MAGVAMAAVLARSLRWGGAAGSRAGAIGAGLPYRATLAGLRAGRPTWLAFRPGPPASTLRFARCVKSALAQRPQARLDGWPGAER